MAFIDRFIKLPIKQFDTNQKELTGVAEYIDNIMYVLPLEISNFKSSIDDENDDLECVSVCMKNGSSFYTYLTMKEFIKLLNEHQK